ncbi:hypothetical protein ABZW18_21025 [Streptomyces sp. NPDC004647]|uniref:hypothetical protein n=1 Tax=Streptomyces sp. NPDC004647 TaxID=3154671 RepID=UPI0033B1E089
MPFFSRSVVSPSDELYFATSSGGNTDSRPDFGESKQMSRTSVAFFATTAICTPGVFDHSRTASAAVRDFPQPRPVSSIHTVHSHDGCRCDARA